MKKVPKEGTGHTKRTRGKGRRMEEEEHEDSEAEDNEEEEEQSEEQEEDSEENEEEEEQSEEKEEEENGEEKEEKEEEIEEEEENEEEENEEEENEEAEEQSEKEEENEEDNEETAVPPPAYTPVKATWGYFESKGVWLPYPANVNKILETAWKGGNVRAKTKLNIFGTSARPFCPFNLISVLIQTQILKIVHTVKLQNPAQGPNRCFEEPGFRKNPMVILIRIRRTMRRSSRIHINHS